jgi:hypothetical protein
MNKLCYLLFVTIAFNTSISYGADKGKMSVSPGKGDIGVAIRAIKTIAKISAASPHAGKTGSTLLPGFVGPKKTGTISPSIDHKMRTEALEYHQDRSYIDSEGRRNNIEYRNGSLKHTISNDDYYDDSQRGVS